VCPCCAAVCVPLQTRQALGGVSSSSTFQPISLERYHHALADADKFAVWLQDYHGTAAQLQAALQGTGAGLAQPAFAMCTSCWLVTSACWTNTTALVCMLMSAVV
jgi:hypothetical protein